MPRSNHTTYSKFIKLKRKYDENKKPELSKREFITCKVNELREEIQSRLHT